MTARKLNDQLLSSRYETISAINGEHPLKDQAPGSYVAYQARLRPGGKVAFFNFRLAKEMGLIRSQHANVMNPILEEVLLNTFGLIIINEWDFYHKTHIDPDAIKDHTYIATRYLQLQHPNKQGVYSGDGRSIWNGTHRDSAGRTWDISSCGTGATCLSPARAINQVFYKSGDKTISYGCGYAEISEGMIDVLFSEIFSRNHIKAERTLAVIAYPGGYCITVRTGLNLLRPSHFFNHLRQNQRQRLQDITDYYCQRQIANGIWPTCQTKAQCYDLLLEQMTRTFAEICAVFESEYIFCWLDWDGDNILADGGIIDFGSVRQFGLYHHLYRFDDDGKWSTTIAEQKTKAKHIVATFAQVRDYLKSGRKKPLKTYLKHTSQKAFDRIFADKKRSCLLHRIGFNDEQAACLKSQAPRSLGRFEKAFYSLEKALKPMNYQTVPDGKTKHALFAMRDLLRLLPQSLLKNQGQPLADDQLIAMLASDFATDKDRKLNKSRRQHLTDLQSSYIKFLDKLSTSSKRPRSALLSQISQRSDLINRSHRMTGDAICTIGEKVTRLRRRMPEADFYQLIQVFLERQVLRPEEKAFIDESHIALDDKVKKVLDDLDKTLKKLKHGL